MRGSFGSWLGSENTIYTLGSGVFMKKIHDYYFLKAKKENYPARSVYKLKEIDKKFHIFTKGQKVLDLGATPGSWTLGAAERVGSEGRIISADINDTEVGFPPQVTFLVQDVFNRSPEFEALLKETGPFDVVMSDMAPKTTGHKGTDQARSAALYEEALWVAVQHLGVGGSFIVKVFMGPDTQAFAQTMRTYFTSVKSFKPKSTRSESVEIFYIGLGFKGATDE